MCWKLECGLKKSSAELPAKKFGLTDHYLILVWKGVLAELVFESPLFEAVTRAAPFLLVMVRPPGTKRSLAAAGATGPL